MLETNLSTRISLENFAPEDVIGQRKGWCNPFPGQCDPSFKFEFPLFARSGGFHVPSILLDIPPAVAVVKEHTKDRWKVNLNFPFVSINLGESESEDGNLNIVPAKEDADYHHPDDIVWYAIAQVHTKFTTGKNNTVYEPSWEHIAYIPRYVVRLARRLDRVRKFSWKRPNDDSDSGSSPVRRKKTSSSITFTSPQRPRARSPS